MTIINGKEYKGRNLQIAGDKVIIDGKDRTPNDTVIRIGVIGDIESLKVDNCNEINVTGNCNVVSSHNGDIVVGGDVNGDVSSHNGNVSCRDVAGSVRTNNGNISHRK